MNLAVCEWRDCIFPSSAVGSAPFHSGHGDHGHQNDCGSSGDYHDVCDFDHACHETVSGSARNVLSEKNVFYAGGVEMEGSCCGRQNAICFGLFWEYVSVVILCG